MNNENKIFGRLFNSIDLQNDEHLEMILNTMDQKTAVFILTQAVKFAFEQGVFSIGESEVISKSIRVLGKPNTTEDPE